MRYETFILRLEDRSGPLLEVSNIISSHNANITRLSYNKVVDQHTAFVEVYTDESNILELSKTRSTVSVTAPPPPPLILPIAVTICAGVIADEPPVFSLMASPILVKVES